MQARRYSPEDLDAVVALVNRAELAGEAELEDRTATAFAQELGAPEVRDLEVWCDDAGEVRAFARTRFDEVGAELHYRLCYAIASRTDAPFEADILRWVGQRLVDAGDAAGRPVRLVHLIAVRDPGRADRLLAAGFHAARKRYSMGRTVAAPIPEAPLPPDYRLRSCRGADDAAGYVDLFNDAFADTLDFSALSTEAFLHDIAGADYAAERDWVLEDDAGQLAGFCYVNADAETPTLAYVAAIGVRRAHRGRGLAAAMLAHALHALRADGVADVHLHVDADSPTGAPRLYTRMGFAIRYVEERLELDDAGVRALVAGSS